MNVSSTSCPCTLRCACLPPRPDVLGMSGVGWEASGVGALPSGAWLVSSLCSSCATSLQCNMSAGLVYL